MSSTSIYTSPICSCIICKKEYSTKGIHSHYRVSHTEKGAESIKKANLASNSISKERNDELRRKSQTKYYLTPKICKECGQIHPYEKRTNKFCSQSCAASYTNKERDDAVRHKQRETLRKTIDAKPKIHQLKEPKFCKVSFCIMCGATIPNSSRKTCSDECLKNRMSFSFKETRRKSSRKFTISTWHTSPYAGKVYLESSWEIIVAKILDENHIPWCRPKYLKYTLNGKRRMYYPDFYLTTYDVYIDPKNAYQQKIDAPKLNAVVDEHKIKLLILNKDDLNFETIFRMVSETGVAPARP